jgi:hypothetical protein
VACLGFGGLTQKASPASHSQPVAGEREQAHDKSTGVQPRGEAILNLPFFAWELPSRRNQRGDIEICCATSNDALKNNNFSESGFQQSRSRKLNVPVQLVVLRVEPFFHPFVGSLPHPFWFWREVPLFRIKSTDCAKLAIDFGLHVPSSICRRDELTVISHLPPPTLSTAEPRCTWWPPKDRDATVHNRTDEVPLASSKMARLPHQDNSLAHRAKSDLQKTPATSAHISRYQPVGHEPPVGMSPADAHRPRTRTTSNKPFLSQPVQIEFESVL